MESKQDYESVKRFIEVESETGCKLISSLFINAKSKITVRCTCGEAFEVTFEKFKWRNKRQCNECSKKQKALRRRKTESQFTDEVKQMCGDEYVLVGKFISYSETVTMKHMICGREWSATPTSILARIKTGGGCRECSYKREGKRRTKTNEDFVLEVYDQVGDEYIFLEEYKKANILIKVRHIICKEEYTVTPNSFLSGIRCKKCMYAQKGLSQRKEDGVFKEEVFNLVGDEYEFLEPYELSNTKLQIKHHECGFVYDVTPSDFLSGYRCPSCNSSKGEKRVEEFLKYHDMEHEYQKSFQDCKTTRPLPFDFFVRNYVLIEYDGEFHFEAARFSKDKQKMLDKLVGTQAKDRIKNQYCIDNIIPLIRIPYWEFDNVENILIEILDINKYSTKVNYESKYNKYIVDANWNQDDYIASNPKNKEAV